MPGTTNPLARVRRAAKAKGRSDAEYRAAIIDAADELERDGTRHVFATIAGAAGTTRQAVRQLVERARRP